MTHFKLHYMWLWVWIMKSSRNNELCLIKRYRKQAMQYCESSVICLLPIYCAEINHPINKVLRKNTQVLRCTLVLIHPHFVLFSLHNKISYINAGDQILWPVSEINIIVCGECILIYSVLWLLDDMQSYKCCLHIPYCRFYNSAHDSLYYGARSGTDRSLQGNYQKPVATRSRPVRLRIAQPCVAALLLAHTTNN